MLPLRICSPVLAAFVVGIFPGGAAGQAVDGAGPTETRRPSLLGVAGGGGLGGVAFSGGAALTGLLLTGGETDCYDGGCATLLVAAAVWPVGAALGARRAIRRQGQPVGFERIFAYSLLGAGLGGAAALAVDEIASARGGPCAHPPAGHTGPTCGTGPGDWVYVTVGLTTHLLTLALLSHYTVEIGGDGSRASFTPAVDRSGVGIAGRIRLR